MLYSPSNSIIESLRRLFKQRVGDAVPAYLGDSDAAGARTDVPGRDGYVYVRLKRTDPPFMARSGQGAYPNYPGAPVYVAYRYNNEPEIVGTNYAALDQVGIDTRVLNPLNQQSRWVYPYQLTYGLASAVATTLTDSFLVTVKKFRHYTGNLLQAFETPLEADKIDFSSYVPVADEHCYACLWIDTYLNEPVVTTSVPQDINTPLDETDLQELVVRTASSRPPDSTPLKAFYLANDQGTLKQSTLEVDLRLWLYNPPVWGFPTALTTLERVRPGYTLVTGSYTPSGVGALTIESGGKVIIVHKNNLTATTVPGVGDDSADGYTVGSLWFNKSTGILYVAEDVTVGAAVWTPVAGSGAGTMSSWIAAGNLGTPQTVTDGQTVTFEGGGSSGINVGGAATRRLVFSVDTTVIRTTGAQNMTGKTIVSSSIGTSTPLAGYFNALRLVIGGIYAQFTHAFTGNHTVTIPGDADVTLVGEDTTQTLSNKTLTTPTIGSFVNATHDHSNAAGGGNLTGTAFGNQTANFVLVGPSSGGAAPPTFRALTSADVPPNDTIDVHGYLLESVTAGQWVAFDSEATTAGWRLANSGTVNRIGSVRGIALASGTSTQTILIRILGEYTITIGSPDHAPLFIDSTNGAITRTMPTPTLDGSQIIICQVAWINTPTRILINGFLPPIYRIFVTSDDDEVTTVNHFTDAPGARRTIARATVYDPSLAETYATSNQDTNLQLRGQSGAGSAVNADTVGGTAYALGDAGGTDNRQSQSFTMTTGTLSQVTFTMRGNAGTPTGQITVSVRADNAGIPSASILWSTLHTVVPSALNTINITGGPFITSGTYWVVWEAAIQGTNNRYTLDGSAASVYAGGVSKADTTTGASFPGTWTTSNAGDIRCSLTTSAVVTNDALAQGVSHASTMTVMSVKAYLRKTGSPTGTLSMTICADSAGSPGSAVTNGVSVGRLVSDLSASYALFEFTYLVGSRPVLTAATQYHLKLTTTGSADNTNYVEWGTDSSSPSYANGQMKTLQSASWGVTSPASDGCFELYEQGLSYVEDLQPGQWSVGGGGQIAVRQGDVSAANTTTITRFKNMSGETQLITYDVILPT